MRLDLILKHSGLIKRRTVAKFYCDHGLVLVNDKVGKPSTDVKANDVISVKIGNKNFTFTVDIKIDGRKMFISYTQLDKEGVSDA